VTQEAVPQPLPQVRPAHEPGDVHEPNVRRHHALGLEDIRQGIEPGVGDHGHADVRLDRGERMPGHRGVGLGQRVEQRRLPGVGQPHDPDLEHAAVLS
jgi:hypothetical protein